MKISWAKYIVGCFLIIAFLFNSVVPDAMIVSGLLTGKMVSKTLAAQNDVNNERSTEETQEDPRTVYLSGAQASFYISPQPLLIVTNNIIIPRDIAYRQTVVIPVLTPPPDVTIV